MQNKLRRGVFLKKSRKMAKEKIGIIEFVNNQQVNSDRLIKCWNILRTLSDKELESLEKQTDLVIEEHGEEFVAVHVGPSLPF